MQFVSFEQFVSMPKHGYIFFFSMDGYCGLCKQYEAELNKYNILNLIKVNSTEEHEYMDIGVKAVPCTRFYNTEDILAYERYGILYQKQIQELLIAFEAQ